MNRIWLGFAALSAVAAAVTGAVGHSLVAPEAVGAVWAGAAASFAGALAGSVPLAAELGRPSGKAVAVIGKATLLRLGVTLVAGVVAFLSGFAATEHRRTLLFSLATSYLALLAVETGWFMRQSRKERSAS